MKTIKQSRYKSIKSLYRDKSRWCKRVFSNEEETACCLSHAAYLIYGHGPEKLKKVEEVRGKLRKEILKIDGQGSIIKFNDCPTTTIEDIRKVVRLAKV